MTNASLKYHCTSICLRKEVNKLLSITFMHINKGHVFPRGERTLAVAVPVRLHSSSRTTEAGLLLKDYATLIIQGKPAGRRGVRENPEPTELHHNIKNKTEGKKSLLLSGLICLKLKLKKICSFL